MDKAAKIRQWKQVEISRKPFDAKAYRSFKKALMSLAKPFIRKLEENPHYGEMMAHDVKFDEATIREAMYNIYEETGSYFAKKTVKDLRDKKDVSTDNPDKFTEDLRRYVQASGGSKITSITMTAENNFRKIIQDILDQGVQEGWSSGKIAQELRDNIYDGWSWQADWQSRRIARTEVATASNRGQLLGAESMGADLKVWISVHDDRTREDHLDAEDEYEDGIPLNAYFDVGGDSMMHPGDGALPEENINCRCTIAFQMKKQ